MYAKFLNIEKKDIELYYILVSSKNRFAIEMENIILNSYQDINLFIIENLISRKLYKELIKYIDSYN